MDVYYCSCVRCEFAAIVAGSKEAITVFDEHETDAGTNHFVEVERLEHE